MCVCLCVCLAILDDRQKDRPEIWHGGQVEEYQLMHRSISVNPIPIQVWNCDLELFNGI